MAQSTHIIRNFNTDKNTFSKLKGSERRSCNFFKMLGITHEIFKPSLVTRHTRMRIHKTLSRQYDLTTVNDGHEELMPEDIPAQMLCQKNRDINFRVEEPEKLQKKKYKFHKQQN